jgi:hypothetical protein
MVNGDVILGALVMSEVSSIIPTGFMSSMMVHCSYVNMEVIEFNILILWMVFVLESGEAPVSSKGVFTCPGRWVLQRAVSSFWIQEIREFK